MCIRVADSHSDTITVTPWTGRGCCHITPFKPFTVTCTPHSATDTTAALHVLHHTCCPYIHSVLRILP